MELKNLSVEELLALYFDVMDELRAKSKKKEVRSYTQPRYTKQHLSPKKLTPSEALEIYHSHRSVTDKEIAEMYGVTPSNVYQIRNGMIWSLVTGHKR